MAVRFILGRAGTGKTQWCFDRIVQSLKAKSLGEAIIWLLPRQATFQAQRLLACTGGLGGFFRVRAVSFEDLGREILAECGGAAAGAAQISDLGRRMILGHLLRQLQPQLKFFQEVAHQPGVAGELDATFDELQRCGQDVAAVKQQMESAKSASPALAAKLHDLSLLWSAYADFLGQERLDPERRLSQALVSIEKCPSLRSADVYVDSFYDFTGYERTVLAALAKVCRSVTITLTLDPSEPSIANPHLIPEEMSLFHRTLEAYRRLYFSFKKEEVAIGEPVLLTEGHRFANKDLAKVERWETGASEKAADGQAIHFIEAPDRQSEVDAVARWVKARVAAGLRYRDIAVLMRSEEEYRDLIETAFGEHGIPVFIDRRRTASHHPLLRLIRAAILIAKDQYPPDAMTSAIKTGLVGLEDVEADELENYVLRYGVRGTSWTSEKPWTGHRRAKEDLDEEAASPEAEDHKRVDAVRRKLAHRLMPFVRAVTQSRTISVRTLARAVFDLLESLAARERIVQWMEQAAKSGRLEERGEHERVWGELVKMFEEMVELVGGEKISLEDFGAILDSGLAGFDLALTPPTVDQVLVGPVDRTRTPNVKACAVLGLSEGQFPRSWQEGTVFTDSDRRALVGQNIDLEPETQRRLLDENFLGYVAFTRASQELLLSRPAEDADGRAVEASPLWERVQRQFENLEIERPPREQDLPLGQISTPRQLIASLMRKVRDNQLTEDWRAVYQWLADGDKHAGPIELLRRRAWGALKYRNDAKLHKEQAEAMFASPLDVSVWQLESFRRCAYQHFARFGLKLSPREQRQVGRADLSYVYHDVLDQLVRQMIRTKRNWKDLDEAELERTIAEQTQRIGSELRGELMLSTARNRYLLARIERTLRAVLAAQKAAGMRGEFTPGWTGMRFGGAQGSPPPLLAALDVKTPGKHQVTVRGKIDRIDLLADGSAAVIDYKLDPRAPGAGEIYYGLSLQLLTCLLALGKNGAALAGKQLIPAAAFCVTMLRKIEKEDPSKAIGPEDPKFNLRVKPRGWFDAKVTRKLDTSMKEGWSEVVQVFISKEGEFGNARNSDATGSEQFASLLRHVERTIGKLADGIIEGQIGIRPYRLNGQTPCERCEFRDLCRFEPSPGAYDELEPMDRVRMLEQVMEEEKNG